MLTLSTTACLCGAYALYDLLVSPIVSPKTQLLDDRNVPVENQRLTSSENKRQAQEFLVDQVWAVDAKYQVRNDKSYIFAEEWEPIDDSRRVRLRPFAMIWRQKNHDR